MKNKIIIVGVIAVAIIAIGVFIMIRQPEIPVVNDMADPVTDPVINDAVDPVDVVEVDETIESKLCRKVITRARLREITNYQGEFIFEEKEHKDPWFGALKMCSIFTEAKEIAIMIGIGEFNFETTIERIAADEGGMMFIGADELDNVGEKALIMTISKQHWILFSDGDINRLVKVIGHTGLTREATVELAKQVETNVR